MVKFCRDCKHYSGDTQGSRCGRLPTPLNPVTGKGDFCEEYKLYALWERQTVFFARWRRPRCGPEGQFWEPRT